MSTIAHASSEAFFLALNHPTIVSLEKPLFYRLFGILSSDAPKRPSLGAFWVHDLFVSISVFMASCS